MARYEVEIKRSHDDTTIFSHATLKEAKHVYERWVTIEKVRREAFRRAWKPVIYTLRTVHKQETL